MTVVMLVCQDATMLTLSSAEEMFGEEAIEFRLSK
jgi:hypothetical protein